MQVGVIEEENAIIAALKRLLPVLNLSLKFEKQHQAFQT